MWSPVTPTPVFTSGRRRDSTFPYAHHEIGYLSYDAHAADLLFQVISRRYEHRSIVVTTNLLFKQWDTVFPNAACAVALIDRLRTTPTSFRSRGRGEYCQTTELFGEL